MRPWYKIHFSTMVVMALVAGCLAFINIPGERTSIVSHRFYHGWPYHYFDREGAQNSFWSFAGTAPTFHGDALLLNVLTALCLVALVACACELWIRRNGRLLRFGTRSLLVATTLIAGLFGLVSRDVRRCMLQRQTLGQLAQYGSLEIGRDLRKFDWLRSLFGDHFHGTVRWVTLSATGPMDQLPDLTLLDSLSSLSLEVENIPENLDHIARFGKLKVSITLTSLANTDRHKLTAITELPQLYSLGLLGDDIDDSAVSAISSDTQLEWIAIGSPALTVNSLRRLSELKSVRQLTLDQAVVQTQDCSPLLHAPQLSFLIFIGNNTTQKDADKMRALWPDAKVVGGNAAVSPTGAWMPSLRVFRYGDPLNSR